MQSDGTFKADPQDGNMYIDTRGCSDAPVTFTQAVIDGLAPGGGLYVPEHVPSFTLDEIVSLADMPYPQRAAHVYKAFEVDIDDARIEELMEKSYGTNFDDPAICPIHTLDNETFMLELWHGPTSAFKDMALQCLPNFFEESARKLRTLGKLSHDFCILVATSGDTGKAALEGFKGIDGVDVCVLFPDKGVSDIQRKQMTTTTGDNVCVLAVSGNFDDCQTGAKKVFSDSDFAEKLLNDDAVALSSANSINWGRLLPQIVYYISSYAELVANGSIEAGAPIDVCVPTGNFGNILAAWYAKQMGTPIETLLCASNENRVLTDFIATGIYDISGREFVTTPSPSMDILVSSNLERQLFELSGRDGSKVGDWMRQLSESRRFDCGDDVREKMRVQFKGASVSNAECLATIRKVLKEYDYLLDPHTAVAYAAANKMRDANPVLVASTAHWAKFGDNVYRAIHDIAPGEPLPADVAKLTGCELNSLISEETGKTRIPANLADLDDMPIRFKKVIGGTEKDIEDALEAFLGDRRRP